MILLYWLREFPNYIQRCHIGRFSISLSASFLHKNMHTSAKYMLKSDANLLQDMSGWVTISLSKNIQNRRLQRWQIFKLNKKSATAGCSGVEIRPVKSDQNEMFCKRHLLQYILFYLYDMGRWVLRSQTFIYHFEHS